MQSYIQIHSWFERENLWYFKATEGTLISASAVLRGVVLWEKEQPSHCTEIILFTVSERPQLSLKTERKRQLSGCSERNTIVPKWLDDYREATHSPWGWPRETWHLVNKLKRDVQVDNDDGLSADFSSGWLMIHLYDPDLDLWTAITAISPAHFVL